MKTKLITIATIILFLASITITTIPVKANTCVPVTKYYGDFMIPQGGGFFWLPHVWDLTKDPVKISYTLDLSEAPNVAYTGDYGQSGYVGLVWPGSP